MFKEDFVRPLFKMETGDVYDESSFKKGFDKLRDIYGTHRLLPVDGRTEADAGRPRGRWWTSPSPMDEDKRYYVGQINVTGNDTTRDKVVRREIYMNEGDVFNTEALKATIRRINQLGYFKPMEGAPDLRPSEKGDDKLDVTFKVEEQNRNQFTFGGGVSGLEGTFINASFSTTNFLGAGETFQLSAQTGRRTQNYQLAITEPYLFDRPITAGLRHLQAQDHLRDLRQRGRLHPGSQGREPHLRPPGWAASRASSRTTRTRSSRSRGWRSRPEPGRARLPASPSSTPCCSAATPTARRARFTPSFVYNTVDNPFTPRRRGMKQTITASRSREGPSGAPSTTSGRAGKAIFYLPVGKKTALGVRVETAYIMPYSDTLRASRTTSATSSGARPRCAGYNVRTIGPIDQTGRLLGGNKFVLANAEYYFDIFGPVRFLFFLDAGQVFLEDQNIGLSNLKISTGAELRFVMPVLNVPFRLIYAYNPNPLLFTPKTDLQIRRGHHLLRRRHEEDVPRRPRPRGRGADGTRPGRRPRGRGQVAPDRDHRHGPGLQREPHGQELRRPAGSAPERDQLRGNQEAGRAPEAGRRDQDAPGRAGEAGLGPERGGVGEEAPGDREEGPGAAGVPGGRAAGDPAAARAGPAAGRRA